MTGDQPNFDSNNKLIEQLDIDFALRAAGLGIWEINPTTNQVRWDERCQALVGLQQSDTIPFQEAIQYIHPDDLDHVLAAIQRTTTFPSDGRFDETYRTVGADEGKLRWVRFWGQAQFTPTGALHRFSGIAQEVTGPVLLQQALNQQQAQERFLLQLSDSLRSLTDPLAVYDQTACLVGQYLGANRVGYAEDQGDGDTIVVRQNYINRVTDLQGTYQYADYGPLLAEFLAGRTVVRSDIAHDPTLTPAQKEAHRLLQLGATLNKPLRKDGRLLAVLFIHYQQAHPWSADELNLLEQVAERLVIAVDRAQAHEALRQSESRFRMMANSVSQAIWVTDAEGNTEFLNQWWEIYSGIPFEPSTAWQVAADSLHPEDGPRLVAAFRQAMRTGTPFEVEQRNRSASGEYRWFLNKGEPYRDPQTGQITKWVGLSVDIHDRKLAEHALQQSEARFRNLITSSPTATVVFTERDMRVQLINEPMIQIWHKDESVVGQTLYEAMPELIGQPFLELLQGVYDTGVAFHNPKGKVAVMVDGKLRDFWLNFAYNALYDADGRIYGVINTATDITGQVEAQQAIEESQQALLALFEQSPVAIATISEHELTFQTANPFYGYLVGRKPDEIIGKPLLEALPELQGQGFDGLLRQVLVTGQPFIAPEVRVELVRNGQLETIYVNLTYQPRRGTTGAISGILVVATDVTAQVAARRNLEDSEAHLQLLRDTVPAMIFYLDEQQRYQSYNQAFREWFKVGDEVMGQTVREFLGEPAYAAIEPHLTKVYSGQSEQYELPAPHPMQADRWLSIVYTPHQTPQGRVLGVIVHATDITPRKQSERILQQSEAALQNAVALAELGTWRMDVRTGDTSLSQRHADMFGLDSTELPFEEAFALLHPDDRERVRRSFEQAMQASSDGHYQAEYRILNARTGSQQHIRARGETRFDEAGLPVSIWGTAQDVTLEREAQLLLESQVQERTQELQLANQDLKRSNDNLQQFAYVASHDLQEPLRKIQSFATLISEHLAGQMDPSVQMYLERITAAGARMSTLMKDLLAYSRISTRQQAFGSVSLEAIVTGVLSVLDWEIQQKGALIQVDALPIVKGDQTQLGQLFQNLLTNALKFVQPGQVPRIHIQAFYRSRAELPPAVHPAHQAPYYHQISVSDEGVGFEEKFLDRIFGVFQRLHGKNEFVGTGVGLAICQRVVENHGGAITARSQPGQGATFCVYLPA